MTNSNFEPGTVYVVDDDPTVLRMLQTLVATIGVSVQAYGTAREFLDAYRPTTCECLLCDLRMPDIDGMELQRRLKEMGAMLPTIFLTGFAEVGVAVQAMQDGALYFMEKPFSAQVLLGKIRIGLERSRSQHAQLLVQRARDARFALLTPKERSVVRLVVDAKSSREISGVLGISVRTVENHRTRIMEKLHVESTVELVKLFFEQPPAGPH